MAPPPPVVVYHQPPPPRDGHGAVVVVVVLLVVVFVVLVGLSFIGVGPLAGIVGDAGSINIDVTHAGVNTISATVLVNGNQVASFSVAPQSTVGYTYTAHWTGNGCYSATVTADGTGGLLGPTSVSKQTSVCNGNTVTVDLTV